VSIISPPPSLQLTASEYNWVQILDSSQENIHHYYVCTTGDGGFTSQLKFGAVIVSSVEINSNQLLHQLFPLFLYHNKFN